MLTGGTSETRCERRQREPNEGNRILSKDKGDMPSMGAYINNRVFVEWGGDRDISFEG